MCVRGVVCGDVCVWELVCVCVGGGIGIIIILAHF